MNVADRRTMLRIILQRRVIEMCENLRKLKNQASPDSQGLSNTAVNLAIPRSRHTVAEKNPTTHAL